MSAAIALLLVVGLALALVSSIRPARPRGRHRAIDELARFAKRREEKAEAHLRRLEERYGRR